MEELRRRYEDYCDARAAARLRFRSGRSAALDLERIDEEFGELTCGEALEAIRKEEAASTREELRDAWHRLGVGVEGAVVAAASRGLSRELAEREAAQTASVAGEERRVFEWRARLGAEPDTARRGRIRDAIDRAEAELNPLREELFARRGELLARRGYATLRAWAEARRPGVDYDAWGARATRLLEATESVYGERLGPALEAIGVAPGAARRSDADRVSRLTRYDRYFTPDRLRPCLDFLTEGMGIRVGDAPGVEIDDAPRPGKNPRACCIAERLPGAVHVLLMPRGGLDDYETLFHEAGHALHFAFTSPALPVERRRVMDGALTETFAFLLHYRVADPDFAAEGPASAKSEPFVRDARLRKLALLRRYAAKIRYELELDALGGECDPRPLAELYAEELSGATGFAYAPESYLADTDDDFYSVDYLRAWCFEAQLSEELRRRFGRRFWRTRACGELLKEIWNTGATYSAEALAAELGVGPIDVDALVEELRS